MVKRFKVRGFYSLKILDRLGLLLPFKSSSFRSFLLWCPSSSRFHGPLRLSILARRARFRGECNEVKGTVKRPSERKEGTEITRDGRSLPPDSLHLLSVVPFVPRSVSRYVTLLSLHSPRRGRSEPCERRDRRWRGNRDTEGPT